jgi:hypothetical protein
VQGDLSPVDGSRYNVQSSLQEGVKPNIGGEKVNARRSMCLQLHCQQSDHTARPIFAQSDLNGLIEAQRRKSARTCAIRKPTRGVGSIQATVRLGRSILRIGKGRRLLDCSVLAWKKVQGSDRKTSGGDCRLKVVPLEEGDVRPTSLSIADPKA